MLNRINIDSDYTPKFVNTINLYPNPMQSGSSPFFVKSVEGLDPINRDIRTIESAIDDGSTYLSSRSAMRNIVLTLEYKPDYAADQSVSSLRANLYQYFMPGANLSMLFETDEYENVNIKGYVENFETPLFSKDPQVQISILCPQPWFKAYDAITQEGASYIRFDNAGTVGTGFILTGTYKSIITTWTMYRNGNSQESMNLYKIGGSNPPANNSPLEINTNFGSRGAKVGYARVPFGNFWFGSSNKWLEVQPGYNSFYFTNSQYITNKVLLYYPMYGGL